MLYRQRLIAELDKCRGEFVEFGREWAAEAADYAARLSALGGRGVEEIRRAAEANLAELGARAFGALPAAEFEREGRFVLPFGKAWRTHEESRAWAVDALLDRATFAADGSQILPGREVSMPVAAVQVAWFENPHARDGAGYRKEWDFRLVTPKELSETDAGPATATDLVSLHRFELELKAVRAFLERRAGWRARGERVPVAFFDGTLLLSTARLRGESLNVPGGYVKSLADTVKLSRETEVPVVGYIDQSYARDLVRLLDVLARRERGAPVVFDAQIFSAATREDSAPLFSNWGDRTVFCRCFREGLPADFRDEAGEPLVGFVYLQTAAPGGTPARLDIPAWVGQDAALLEDVIDAVRAECVVGNGYPYALETADEAAVITARDREQFLRAVQDFAEANRLAFRVSRKAISKIHRR
ncbi:MAG TPA: DNA double-strand break repair nuclease NurA [Pyrinomonadaceae bacterium]